MRDLGACISPFNSFLLLLGVETLHVRMREHCDNALRVAEFVQAHPAVAWVRYPGLPTHPTYALAQRYFRDGRSVAHGPVHDGARPHLPLMAAAMLRGVRGRRRARVGLDGARARASGGAIVVFGIRGGRAAGMRFIEKLALWSHLANVGDAKSLVIHPASTTHAQLSKDELAAAGVSEDLIRLGASSAQPYS